MQVFNVQGMSCGHCVRSVTQAVQAGDPQAGVEIDLSKGEVRVQSELAAEHVAQLIKDKGYPVTIA